MAVEALRSISSADVLRAAGSIGPRTWLRGKKIELAEKGPRTVVIEISKEKLEHLDPT